MPVAQYTVLIVDDNAEFRALMKRRLEAAGFETMEACDGEHAINSFKVETPDIVLLDINMPNKNGYEVLDWLEHNKIVKTKVIVLTGDSMRDNVVTCLTLGAKDFVLKSAPKTELLNRIKLLCETKSLKEANHDTVRSEELYAAPILIVDDEELSVNITARRLEKEGYTVVKAHHADEAQNIIKTKNIRLALLDIHMPDINGFDLLKMIRKDYPPEQIGIIMLTANDDAEMVIDCIQHGADDYIMKPFHQAELLIRVQACLQHTLITQKEQTKRRRHEDLAQLGLQIKNSNREN